jgi:hypothetical protein
LRFSIFERNARAKQNEQTNKKNKPLQKNHASNWARGGSLYGEKLDGTKCFHFSSPVIRFFPISWNYFLLF